MGVYNLTDCAVCIHLAKSHNAKFQELVRLLSPRPSEDFLHHYDIISVLINSVGEGMRWKKVLKADPTDWLLEEEDPSVRYLALRDIVEAAGNQLQSNWIQ